MKNFFILKFLDLFRVIFIKVGIDYYYMRKILQVRLTMDNRRELALNRGGMNKKYVEGNSNFILTLGIYLLFGFLMVPMTVMSSLIENDMEIPMLGMFFGVVMFIIVTTLISDFSTVLLDLRDKNIISSKPIDSKTINMAKIIHILIYLSFITIAIAGPTVIAKFVIGGLLYGSVIILELILINLLVLILTALSYLVMLKLFDGDKLKDLINGIQIVLSIFMFISYQFIGRMFQFQEIFSNLNIKWIQYFIIPMWFTAPVDLIVNQKFDIHNIILTLFVVIIPIIAIIVYIKQMPNFEKNLQKLNNSDIKSENKISEALVNLFQKVCYKNEEKVIFKFVYKMMSKKRDFKLRTYPSIAMMLVFPLIIMFNFSDMDIKKYSYLSIYMTVMIGMIVIENIKYTDNSNSSWIYYIVPIRDKYSIDRAVIKAVLVKFYLPLYLILSIFYINICGIGILKDLIVILIVGFLISILYHKLTFKDKPFSKNVKAVQKSNTSLSMVFMFLMFILAGVHFAIMMINSYLIFIYMVVILIISIILWNLFFSSSENH